MRYYKKIIGGYIDAIGTGYGGEEITKEEYNHILSVVKSAPKPEDGYKYRLKADRTWEMIEAPSVPEEEREISAVEALRIITGGANE